MNRYLLIWSPEGRVICEVEAKDPVAAMRLLPKPYRKYKGEVYVQTPEEREKILRG